MAKPRTPRASWIDAGLGALAAGGPEAVRVEALAQSLGVTKGGFYGYFADRGALLDEMLDTWERVVTELVVEQVERTAGDRDARTKLRRLGTVVAATEADPRMGVDVELAIRDWARHDPAVARRLRRVDTQHVDYLRSLFAEFCPDELEVEARSLAVMSIRLGDHLIRVGHGTLTRAEVIGRLIEHQLA